MDGIFYAFENEDNPKIYLLRFYGDTDMVIAKTIFAPQIDDLAKALKTFHVEGFTVMGPPEEIYMGGFTEGSSTISFKIENEIVDSADKWSHYDLLTFKGKIISDDELQLNVISKTFHWNKDRTYFRAKGNTIQPPEKQ